MRLRYSKYSLNKGVQKIKTRAALVLSALALAVGSGGGLSLLLSQNAFADSSNLYVYYLGTDTGNNCQTESNPCQTIQYAVSVAVSGATINVAAGTYHESITINKPLTIEGAGPNSTILDGNSATENYYMVSIEANDVTVENLAITNPLYTGTADASGITTYNAGRKSNLHITNVKIHNIGTLTRPVTSGTYGINSGPVNGLEIDNSEIYNIGDGDATSEAVGILTWGNDTSDTAYNINFHDNNIHDITNSVASSGFRTAGYSTNVIMNHNTFTGPFKTGGIVTSSGMNGLATITNNTVTGASAYGILLKSPFAQTLTGNTVSGATVGIQVNDTATVATTINRNSISGNTMGLNNSSTNLVNATCNWWGSASGPGPVGPGSGDTVSANVNFTPWLLTNDLSGSCAGYPHVTTKDQCKNDGWQTLTDNNNRLFKNQGSCVSSFVSNGKSAH